MPIRERLLLAATLAALMLAPGFFMVGGFWLFCDVLGLHVMTAFMLNAAILAMVAGWALTITPGAPRWFQREDR